LDETVIDLENSNDRCIQLGSELKLKMNEVEKLRIFKFMARQADIREDNLRAKVS
jgi:urease beta subunit